MFEVFAFLGLRSCVSCLPWNCHQMTIRRRESTAGGGFAIPVGKKPWWSWRWITVYWAVATQIFLEFSPRKLGKIPILTNIFQRGWNHQLDYCIERSHFSFRYFSSVVRKFYHVWFFWASKALVWYAINSGMKIIESSNKNLDTVQEDHDISWQSWLWKQQHLLRVYAPLSWEFTVSSRDNFRSAKQ